MPDIPVALFSLWAVMRLAEYLDSGKLRDSVAFGVAASLAILTHGAAIFLAVAPPAAVLLQRRPRSMLRPAFWLPAVIVAAAAGPWYLHTPGARHEFAVDAKSWGLWLPEMWRMPGEVQQMVGTLLALMAVVGLVDRILWPIVGKRTMQPVWACVAASLLGFCALRTSFAPASEPRHLLIVLPQILMLACAGFMRLAAWHPAPGWPPWRKQLALALATAVATGVEVLPAPKRAPAVFAPIVADLIASKEFERPVVLISSNAMEREGQFIAAVAMRERRPGHYILRASKALVSVGMLANLSAPSRKDTYA
jgi:hypothetical protein